MHQNATYGLQTIDETGTPNKKKSARHIARMAMEAAEIRVCLNCPKKDCEGHCRIRRQNVKKALKASEA